MFLIPYDTLTITSKLNTDEVISRLLIKGYDVQVSKEQFRLRSTGWHHPYAAWVKGKCVPVADGTDVLLTFTIEPTNGAITVGFFIWAQMVASGFPIFFLLLWHCGSYWMAYLPARAEVESLLNRLLLYDSATEA